jgi:2-dehydropantoate 2-reductase
MTAAGLAAPRADIRATMWAKLLGNVYANPICALTGIPLGPVVSHPETRELAMRLMNECASVAASLGVSIPMSFEERLRRSAAVGAARPSMLQDRDAGRPMELDAILGALVELGDLQGIATPSVRSLLACLRLIESRHSY